MEYPLSTTEINVEKSDQFPTNLSKLNKLTRFVSISPEIVSLITSFPDSLVELEIVSEILFKSKIQLPPNLNRLVLLYNDNFRDFSWIVFPESLYSLELLHFDRISIDIGYTEISIFEIHHSDRVKIVNFPNKIESIDFSDNDSIELTRFPNETKSINLSHLSGIKKIDVSYLHRLSILDIGYTSVRELDDLPQSLEVLKISGTRISRIPKFPDNLRTLEIVSMDITELIDLPQGLEELDVSQNSDLTDIEYPLSLTKLTIRYTNIKSLGNISFIPLLYLDISYNLFTDLLDLPNSLVYLDASHNKIREIPSEFDFLQDLVYLDLSYNKISEIVNLPENLESLDVSHNDKIKEVVNLPNLINLDVGYNRISTIPILPSSLKRLDLSYNDLENVNEFGDNLEVLNLSGNNISEISQIPKNLKILKLSFNKFKKLNKPIVNFLKSGGELEIIGNDRIKNCDNLEITKDIDRCISSNSIGNVYDVATKISKPKRKYGFENACQEGDLAFVQRYRKEFLGLDSTNDIKSMCKSSYQEIVKYEEEMDRYDRDLKCCLGEGEECEINCEHLLDNNQCRDLVVKDFKDVMMNELYVFTEDGVRYCFLLTEIIKGNGLNPLTGNPLPISKEEALGKLINFYSWRDWDTVKLPTSYVFNDITDKDASQIRRYIENPSKSETDNLLGLSPENEVEIDGWKYYLIPEGTLLFRSHQDNLIRFPSDIDLYFSDLYTVLPYILSETKTSLIVSRVKSPLLLFKFDDLSNIVKLESELTLSKPKAARYLSEMWGNDIHKFQRMSTMKSDLGFMKEMCNQSPILNGWAAKKTLSFFKDGKGSHHRELCLCNSDRDLDILFTIYLPSTVLKIKKVGKNTDLDSMFVHRILDELKKIST